MTDGTEAKRDESPTITEEHAKQGRKGTHLFTILVISLVSVVIVLGAAWWMTK
jgi:hypothetical protein